MFKGQCSDAHSGSPVADQPTPYDDGLNPSSKFCTTPLTHQRNTASAMSTADQKTSVRFSIGSTALEPAFISSGSSGRFDGWHAQGLLATRRAWRASRRASNHVGCSHVSESLIDCRLRQR